MQESIEKEAISIVNKERLAWEDAVAFITDRVAFNMRNLIRNLRKNYWGIFDEPTDPVTQRDKVWIPLTETLCEAVVKNIDLDTKDLNFRAKKPEATGLSNLVRHIVKNKLDEQDFGEKLDELERVIARDGTAVWKTIEAKDEYDRKTFKILPVDLLNVYIDPTAPNIQEAYRFTERSLMTEEEVRGMTGWLNTEGITGTLGLARTDDLFNGTTFTTGASTTKMVDVFEMWGKIPEYLITGNRDNKDEIEGHIIVSGLSQRGRERLHLLEKNTKRVKPYEEAWYTKVPGRWYGKGIAEKVLMLQIYLNLIVNIRINRATVSQLGIFKIKRGAGITPQMISRLAANGAILVNDQADIEQFVMQEASQASYTDEQNIWDWSQKVTSAFEAAIGEPLPASTPATNAALSNQSAQSQFVLIKEGLGMFLQRWIRRQVAPILKKSITVGDIIRCTGDPEEVRAFDERIVYEKAIKEIDRITQANGFIDPDQVISEIERAKAQLQAAGKDRYVELKDKVDLLEYDVEVYITNEEFDKGVMSQNLLTELQIAPEYKDQILSALNDLMGIPPFKQNPRTMQAQQMPQQGQPQPGMPQLPSQNPTAQVTSANTMQNA